MVRAFICAEFSSKNVILNCSRFSGGIGFSILGGDVYVGDGDLPISVLCGMWSITG